MHIPESWSQESSGTHPHEDRHPHADTHPHADAHASSAGTHHQAERHQHDPSLMTHQPHHGSHEDQRCDRTPVSCQEGFMLARAYVVNQQLGRVFAPADALRKGTLFPELVRPYP